VSAFFDTNILVYAQQTGKISVQVLNEFTVIYRRKQRKDWREIIEAISDVLTAVDPPLALTLGLHSAARTLAEDHQLPFYDALIVASAIEAGCDTLFTEAMQHDRTFGRLAIVNPFLESAA
jgi:predicted nucleic acid-binding protein